MDRHQKNLIQEDHEVLAKCLLVFHENMQLFERSKLLDMKPVNEIIANLKNTIRDLKNQIRKADKSTKKILHDELDMMIRMLKNVVRESNDIHNFVLFTEAVKKGQKVKINSPDDGYDGQVGMVAMVSKRKEAVTVDFKDGQRVSFGFDELVDPKSGHPLYENVSIGGGAIPTGPESVGVKVKPDFTFRGTAGFDCSPETFSKCLKGKKKHKRWNVYLNRDDELVGKVKNYMGQSYKNTNFVLRNSKTKEMVMGRRS